MNAPLHVIAFIIIGIMLFTTNTLAQANYRLNLGFNVSKSPKFERGGLIGIVLTAVDNIPVTASGFTYSFEAPSATQLWLQNDDDVYNPPSYRGVQCKASGSTNISAILTVGLVSAREQWNFHFNANIPVNTPLTCWARWAFLAPTDRQFSFRTPQTTPEAPSRATFSITTTPISPANNFIPPSVTFSKLDYIKDFSKLHMGWLDQSYLEFTASGLGNDLAIPIGLFPVFTNDDGLPPITIDATNLQTWQNNHFDDVIAVYNIIGVVCDPTSQVRLYMGASNQLFLVTGSQTSSSDLVKCKIPFSWNALNRLQHYPGVDPSRWPSASVTWLVYVMNGPNVVPTQFNSVKLSALQYHNIKPSSFQVSYQACGSNQQQCAIATGNLLLAQTTSKIRAKLIHSNDQLFTPSLNDILAVTKTSLTSQLNNPIDLVWNSNGELAITSHTPNQISQLTMTTTITAPAMLSSTFALHLILTSGTNDQELIIYYQPPIEMDPGSQVDTSTFSTTHYTINYKLRFASATTTNHPFLPTTAVSNAAFNLYMEPNLETRQVDIENTVPLCTFTSTSASSDLKLSVERRYRQGLGNFDTQTNRYYYLTIQNAKVGDLFTLQCTYKIITTKKNWFPAPVDLLNYVQIRDMTSSTVSQLGWPQVIDWKDFWDPFQTGPRIYMATEGRPNLCFVLVGPGGDGTITSQSTLGAWVGDWLELVRGAATIDGGSNWFVDQDIAFDSLHWSWALSYYYNRGFREEKNGLFGIKGLSGDSFMNEKVHINSINAENSLVWICGPNDKTKVVDGQSYPDPIVDTPIPNEALLSNTLFREATAASGKYFLHAVQVGKDQATKVGFYYEQNLSYFQGTPSSSGPTASPILDDFVPVLNVAMGAPCQTTPQTQAQGIDMCYKGIGVSWFELPGEYLQWSRQYKQLTYSSAPIHSIHLAEEYGFDLFTWKYKTLIDNGGSTDPPDECEDQGEAGCGGEDEEPSPASPINPNNNLMSLSLVLLSLGFLY